MTSFKIYNFVIQSDACISSPQSIRVLFHVKYYKSLARSVPVLSLPSFFMGVTFKKILGRAVNYGKINVDS